MNGTAIALRQIVVKYGGSCAKCNADIPVGANAAFRKYAGLFCPPCAPTDAETLRPYLQAGAERKAERFREWADKREKKADALHDEAHRMASHIPLGQPILVGHHSEGRDRRYRDRIHNKFGQWIENSEKAGEMRGKAAALEQGPSIKGDREARRQAMRDRIRPALRVGMKVGTPIYGDGVIERINKKTVTCRRADGVLFKEAIHWLSGGELADVLKAASGAAE